MIIIHTGTNDIQNKVNTLQKVRKVITTIKEIDVNNEIQIAFSSVIRRDDQDFEEEIKEINRKLENLRKGKGIKFTNNNNIDGSCLNRSKMHLNKSGIGQLGKKFSQPVNGSHSDLKQFLESESPLKTMKNTFYFTLKALFVLKIFRFLS